MLVPAARDQRPLALAFNATAEPTCFKPTTSVHSLHAKAVPGKSGRTSQVMPAPLWLIPRGPNSHRQRAERMRWRIEQAACSVPAGGPNATA
jgi:hypothetical protein